MKKGIYRNLLIIFILLIDLQVGIGQYQPLKVIPPSPEATSIFKFTEVPVTYFSGLANTSIPLYEVKAGSITIPVNLSYHARGVRVEEIAPRVGIGWSLNFGGMISRQARGMCDDQPNAGYLTRNFYNNIFTDVNVNASVYSDYIDNAVDLEPDMFMFDVAGLSGKFMIDQRDQSILLQSYSDTKIVPVWVDLKIQGWIVTDNEGNKYYFGLSKDQLRKAVDEDIVHNYSFSNAMTDLGSSQERPINTWHLMEIETATNDLIQFTYETEESIYYKRNYDQNISDGPRAICYFSQIHSRQNQIKEISFRNEKIKFTRSATEREDILNAYALQKVEIFDKNDLLVKGYSFQYQYHGTVQDNNQLPYLKQTDPGSNKRLFLHSIQEIGKSGTATPPYIFTYSNIPLPNRFSNSQDAWGFYNGANNGHFLTFFQYATTPVNREVDTARAEAGLLKKITYPTGGSVSFTYEHNKALPPAFMNKLLFPGINQTEIVPVVDGFLKHPMYYEGDGDYTYQFTIPDDKKGAVTFEFELPHYSETEDQSLFNYSVRLEGEGYNIIMNPPTGVRTLNIPSGTYRIKVSALSNHDPSDFRNLFVVYVRWNEERNVIDESGDGPGLLMAAGKRVKRITYRNPDGTAKIKTFDYTIPGTNKSSGVLLGLPNFYFIQRTIVINGVPTPVVDKYGSIPGSPLTNLQGNGIGYSHVTEYYGDEIANTGKIEYKFTTTEDGGKYYEFPYHMPIDNEWLRGRILSMKVYEKTSSAYNLKKETVNKYAYAGEPEAQGFFFTPFLPMGQNHVYSKSRKNFYLPLIIYHKDTLFPYNFKVYYQTGGVMGLYSSTETDYEQGGISMQKKTDYFFDYDKHYQSIRNETLNSKGNRQITRLYFPPDIASRSTAEQKLVDLNRIATPIKVESIVQQKETNVVLSKVTTYNNFRDWGSDVITPELVQSANNSNPLETDAQFFSYDNFGNPTEIAEKDGVHVTYLWGYDSKYPVAKVAGSNYNAVKDFVNLAMLANAHQYTDQQIRDELNKIRVGLASTNAMVSTYTYKPLFGITSETDPKGRSTYYEYDGLGRLVLIRNHENHIVKKIGYSYAASLDPPVIYSNVAKSGQFTRNNCSGGSAGTVTYLVAAGTYTSYISQLDADQQAQDDVNTNGQAYSNSHGACTFSSVAKSGVFTRNNCGTGTGSSVTYAVEAGAYTSTISQADADEQAQNDVNTNGQAYANSHGACTFSSVAKSGVYTRNNCGTATGSSVTYTVNAGAYSSAISQEDADQKAQNDVNTNGQNYANSHGTCTQVIYATIQLGEVEPVFEFGCFYQYRDVVAQFWSDAAHTIPYSVANLPIQIRKRTTQYVNGQVWSTSDTDTPYTCNGTSFTLSQQLTYEGCADDCPEFACLPTLNDPHTTYGFSLVQSTFSITLP